ncbi:MAG: hypothetical protein KAT05_13400 [Spirochaetes bacterium]|nr:hypothetical protein [Spirochaetota bacterium]
MAHSDLNKDFLANISKYKPLAHHPDCDLHSNHLIRIFRQPLCLGCFCVCLGIILGVLIFYFNSTRYFSGPQLYMIGVLVYLPTIVQFKVQNKLFKIVSRFMLGIAIVLLLGSIFFKYDWSNENFIWKFGAFLVFFVVLKLTLNVRNRFLDNPCFKCSSGNYPFCTYKLPKIKQLAQVRNNNEQMLEKSDFSRFIEVVIKQLEEDPSKSEIRVDFETVHRDKTP